MVETERGRHDVRLEELRVNYEQFKAEIRSAGQESATSIGLLAIPDVRRTLGGRISREEFDTFVLRLHAEGLVHLMSHVEPRTLPADTIGDCLCDDTGLLLYWLRWL